jgi:hypothetical protein
MDAGLADADLLVSLTAIGRAMQKEFDPRRFLEEFSARLQGLIPHDRLVIDHLHEDGRSPFSQSMPHRASSSTRNTTPPPSNPRRATSWMSGSSGLSSAGRHC